MTSIINRNCNLCIKPINTDYQLGYLIVHIILVLREQTNNTPVEVVIEPTANSWPCGIGSSIDERKDPMGMKREETSSGITEDEQLTESLMLKDFCDEYSRLVFSIVITYT